MMISPALATPPVSVDETAFRQLRHQTKNALQRILCQLARTEELQQTPRGQRLVHDLERRIRLSSAVSDALFGITSRPGPLADRLRALGDATAELMGDPDQLLTVTATVECDVPPRLEETILRIAHEFVANAVKHGMNARTVGAVTVRVDRAAHAVVRLQVLDDGWGPCCDPDPGEGTRIAASLARQHNGRTTLSRRNGLTVAEALLHTR